MTAAEQTAPTVLRYRRLARQSARRGDRAGALIYARQAELLQYAWENRGQISGSKQFRWYNTETKETRRQIIEPGTSGRGKKQAVVVTESTTQPEAHPPIAEVTAAPATSQQPQQPPSQKQQQLPAQQQQQPKQFGGGYTALVLSDQSRQKLLDEFAGIIPEGEKADWELFAHHMTTNLGGAENGPAKGLLGQSGKAKVVAIGISDKAIAVEVQSDVPSDNARKHITIAVNRAKGGKPKDSNAIPPEGWHPVVYPPHKPFLVDGKVEHQGGGGGGAAGQQQQKKQPPLPPPAAASPRSGHLKLADAVRDKLAHGQKIVPADLRAMATEAYGGTMAGGKYGYSDATDAMEAGFNAALVGKTDPSLEDLSSATKQAERLGTVISTLLPTQTNRSGEKDSHQQFSTPPHYAYAAAWLANLTPDDVVLEPSAGTGCIAVQIKNAGVSSLKVNEISKRRAEFLADLFGKENVSTENAEQISGILTGGDQPTAIVMNPPFSQTAGRMGSKKEIMTGARHIDEALRMLAPGGRLVAIVGRGMSPDSPTFKSWFQDLAAKKGCTLRANVGVSGKEYGKYGTHFDTRVLVIDKTSGDEAGAEAVTGDVNTIPELMGLLEGVRNDRPQLARQSAGQPVRTGGAGASGETGTGISNPAPSPAGNVSGLPAQSATHGAPGQLPGTGQGAGSNPGVGPAATGHGGGDAGAGLRATAGRSGVGGKGAAGTATGSAGQASGPAIGSHEGSGAQAPQRGSRGRGVGGKPVQQPVAAVPKRLRSAEPVKISPVNRSKPDEPGFTGFDRLGREWRNGEMVRVQDDPKAAKQNGAQEEEKEGGEHPKASLYESYQPAVIQIEGSAKHTTPLVESAAMSAVAPPVPSYSPVLSPDLIKEGILSDAQLESVVYAGEAHQKFLPAAAEGEEPSRRGFFIGDGCVAAGTRIYNPQTEEHTPIEQLVGKQHTVMSLTERGFEPCVAVCTFLKGVADLYRVTLEDGRTIVATREHRFLTPAGWQTLGGLAAGDRLACADRCVSSDAPTRSACAPHGWQIGADYSRDYWQGSRRCGEPLPYSAGSAQAVAPSPGDARGYIHLLCGSRDALAAPSPEYTLPAPSARHLSRSNSCGVESLCHASSGARVYARCVRAQALKRRAREQSATGSTGLQTRVGAVSRCPAGSPLRGYSLLWSEVAHREGAHTDTQSALLRRAHGQYPHPIARSCTDRESESASKGKESHASFSCGHYSRWLRIVQIDFVGREAFYDMHVPGPENYVAEGFVNHNTGVGKGRQIAGILTDNINQGRTKHVWISQKQNLLEDAQRDWQALGQNEGSLHHFDRIRNSKEPPADGVAFITYDTLKGRPKDPEAPSNLDQLAGWMGDPKDFDGVIILDESHSMSNALASQGARGTKDASQRALAGIELQKRFPKARVVYVSATGATEVSNLAYAERLGLWGRGTPFPSQEDFINNMNMGGVAAMEAVAQSLKAMGSYTARSLSFDDGTPEGRVTYDRVTHHLSADQRAQYDAAADAWQAVLKEIDKALEISGGSESKGARSAAMSQFWGAQQRFFNQLMTSMQTPSVIQAMEKDLAEGRSPVIQLVNTMEAATKRALDSREEGQALEDLDVSPKEILMGYLEKSFPVHRYEEYSPDGGKTVLSRVAMSDSGTPIRDPEAEAIRDEMLAMVGMMRIPESPIDMIVNHFGHEAVAEATGRTQRIIEQQQDDGTRKKVLERRNTVNANAAEASAFQSGKKKILVFSDAGGTGRSYHADKGAENQAQRVHYMLQPGWRADNAVQGLGRTHRTNQAVAPTYRLVEIEDLKSQKRFISTIARRLDQLGALTKGQRQAGGGGLFSAADNLEGPQAREAMENLFKDLERNAVPGLVYDEVIKQLGLDPPEAVKAKRAVPKPAVPDSMGQFLNRLLSLRVDMQARVFDAFDTRLKAKVDQAVREGTLDTGVENYPAKKITRQSSNVVYKDPGSGAEVKHVVTKVTTPSEKVSWDQVAKFEGVADLVGYVQNKQSGRVYSVYKTVDKTDRTTGKVISQYRLVGPTGGRHYKPVEDFGQYYGKYDKLEPEQARAQWDREYSEAPDFDEHEEHFLTGAILPVWDRIPGNERPRIYRLKTDDGQTVVGRHVPRKLVPEMQKKMGIVAPSGGATGGATDPASLYPRLAGGRVNAKLSNGWKLKPVRVQGERRIELLGGTSWNEQIGYAAIEQLKKDGVIVERVNYNTRFFIPVGDAGAEVLRRVTEHRPVIEVEEPEQHSRQDQARLLAG